MFVDVLKLERASLVRLNNLVLVFFDFARHSRSNLLILMLLLCYIFLDLLLFALDIIELILKGVIRIVGCTLWASIIQLWRLLVLVELLR